MGCSASRLDSLVAKAIEDPAFSLSPHYSSTCSASTKATSSSSSATSKPGSLAAPLVHHPALGKGDTTHLVSLTSTTYGSLIIVHNNHPSSLDSAGDFPGQSSPDSVINTWELMEGLEDDGNITCDSSKNTLSDSYVFVEMPQCEEVKLDEGDSNNSNDLISKPLWKHLSEESLLSKMDPNVVSSYQRALSTRNLGYNHNNPTLSPPCNKLNISIGGSSPFCPTRSKTKLSIDDNDNDNANANANANASKEGVGCGGEDNKIVLYFTSLRGIRRSYEDCCAVRLILKGYRVVMDERDISMDSSYKKELQSAVGGGGALSLPHLFLRGRHIGGADEIKQLHETGELERLLDGFPVQDYYCSFLVCDICGDARFIPCSTCNGSRKVFLKHQQHTNRCPDCNENGLIHCLRCCS